MHYGIDFLIIFLFLLVIVRLIFRFFTRNYRQASGVIVDYKTELFNAHDSHYYIHKPIIEFYVDGECYRLVKEIGFTSYKKEWEKTKLKRYINMDMKVRYDVENPRRCYSLITPQILRVRFFYNLPTIIILLIFYVIVVLYLYTQIKK